MWRRSDLLVSLSSRSFCRAGESINQRERQNSSVCIVDRRGALQFSSSQALKLSSGAGMTRILSKFRASNSAGLGQVPESPGRGNASWEIRLCFERSKLRQTKLHHTFSLTPKFYRQISPIRRRLRIRILLSGSRWFVLCVGWFESERSQTSN